jgi:hypothetical protein
LSSPSSPTAVADNNIVIPAVRKSISSTTTFYLKTAALFTVGTLKCYGRISARRAR